MAGARAKALAPFLTGEFAKGIGGIEAWIYCEVSGGKPTFPTGELAVLDLLPLVLDVGVRWRGRALKALAPFLTGEFSNGIGGIEA